MTEAIPCLSTISEIRATLDAARARGATVGMVPTMGALHEGHLSLVRAARAENDVVVVSIFVNPTQFGPNEDLKKYPRDLEGDRAMCQGAGADLIFSPAEGEMYPEGYSTWVEVEGLTDGLCGRSRPGHFRGVCTVVSKLLNICRPDRAYFGEKDVQQLAVITRMVRNLDMRVDVVPCPTVREADGLAMSSRNRRLTPEARAQAPVLYRALSAARDLVLQGERDTATLDSAVRSILAEAPMGEIDYIEIVDAGDLTPVTAVAGECVIALAVKFGDVRLIDNIRVTG
jgi:pantoate--beta-alanine ligase